MLYASVVPPYEADQDAYLGRVDVRRHRIRPVVAVDLEGLEVRVVDFLDRSSLLLWLHNPYGDSDPRSDSYLAAFDLRTQAVHRITPDGQLVASGSAVAGEEYVVYDEIGRGGSHRFLRWASLDGTRSGVLRQGAWADPHVTGGGRVVAYRETGQPGQTDALGFLELSDAPWLG